MPWPPPRSRFSTSPSLIVALCAIVAGAIVELSFSSTHEVNGVVTDCSYTNLGPVVFGAVGVAASLRAVLTRHQRSPERSRFELGAGLLLGAVALLQVLSGLGLLGGVHLSLDPSNPC